MDRSVYGPLRRDFPPVLLIPHVMRVGPSEEMHLARPPALPPRAIAPSLPRRAVLTGLGALGLMGMAGCSAPHGAPDHLATPRFLTLSRRLTGYDDLDTGVGSRIEMILRDTTTGFDAALASLEHALSSASSRLSLTQLPAQTPARTLADAILRAWQTGVVGEGSRAVVVSYEDTLMYRPIADVCVLPTYARGEPHYWAQPVHPPRVRV